VTTEYKTTKFLCKATVSFVVIVVDIEVFRVVLHCCFYHRNYSKGTCNNCLLSTEKQQQQFNHRNDNVLIVNVHYIV